jgi:hypothetical protein
MSALTNVIIDIETRARASARAMYMKSKPMKRHQNGDLN